MNTREAGRSGGGSSSSSQLPVSSLLPPIPPTGGALAAATSLPTLQAGAAAPNAIPPAVQAHLAAELLRAGLAPSLTPTPASAATDIVSAAAANLLPAANASTNAMATNSLVPNMQNWSLPIPVNGSEQHANLLQQLLADAQRLADGQREEEKKKAKREANRKSAYASRARKKAQVQEMAERNAQLYRQASILALLPDLVIVINVEGVITFCSVQVERVLGHKIDDLTGAKLTELLIPSSREKLMNLIAQLVESEQNAKEASKEKSGGEKDQEGSSSDNTNRSGSGVFSSGPAAAAAFPLSVVKVGLAAGASYENETSDTSGTGSNRGEKTPSSITNSASRTRSPNSSLQGNSGTDDGQGQRKCAAVTKNEAKTSSSDTSNSSSLSTNAKRLQKANANLERNVRRHNKKVKDKAAAVQLRAGYKDDVIGADVTANNATARLSSLQHQTESSSSEEDSGYRESNDSREETSSSTSEVTSINRRRKPLAPTCNVCLIRHDLTKIWCEVTASIQTRSLREASEDMILEDVKPRSASSSSNAATKTGSPSAPTMEGETPPTAADDDAKELLLCLRPLGDGEENLDETFRVVQPRREPEKRAVSEDSYSGPSGGMASCPSSSPTSTHQPPKGPHKNKRPPPEESSDRYPKQKVATDIGPRDSRTAD